MVAGRTCGDPGFDLPQPLLLSLPGWALFAALDPLAGRPVGWELYRDCIVPRRALRPEHLAAPAGEPGATRVYRFFSTCADLPSSPRIGAHAAPANQMGCFRYYACTRRIPAVDAAVQPLLVT